MGYNLIPMGSATGPYWQYRLERAGQFTPWTVWKSDLLLEDDPDGGDLRTDTQYYLHAQNPVLSALVEGSPEKPLACPCYVTGLGLGVTGLIESNGPDAQDGANKPLFVPADTATGPGWQYQIEREGVFSPWIDWQAGVGLNTDPAGGDLRRNALYWVYARNASIASGEPGSTQSPFVAGVQIRADGNLVVVDTGTCLPAVPARLPTLDEVAHAGSTDERGITDQLVKLLGGLFLDHIPTTTENYPQLVIGPDGKVWQRGVAEITYRLKSLEQFVFSDEVVTTYRLKSLEQFVFSEQTGPLWRLRFDDNTCGTSSSGGLLNGWGVDLNNPGVSPTLDVYCDVTKMGTVTASIPRPDVVAALIEQGLLPPGSTYNKFGFSYQKSLLFFDGQPHAWTVRSPDGTVTATSDTGALTTLICGLSGPTIIQQVIRGYIDFPEGDTRNVYVVNRYSDDTEGNYTGPGNFSLKIPYPNGVAVSNSGAGTATVAVPADSLSSDVEGLLYFTFPDERVISQPILFINVSSPPTVIPVITQVKRNWSGASILYKVYGENLNISNGDPYGLQIRWKVGEQEIWSEWEGPYPAGSVSPGTFAENIADPDTTTVFEVRIVNTQSQVYPNSTLQFLFTTITGASPEVVVYTNVLP